MPYVAARGSCKISPQSAARCSFCRQVMRLTQPVSKVKRVSTKKWTCTRGVCVCVRVRVCVCACARCCNYLKMCTRRGQAALAQMQEPQLEFVLATLYTGL